LLGLTDLDDVLLLAVATTARPALVPPPDCVAVASWSVLLRLDASASALLLTSCDAELEPRLGSPPTTNSGAFAFTAFCLAFASASASCFVSPIWTTFCSWPLPPQPDQHDLPPVWVAVAS
jgi:hypothetical protein